MNPFIKIRHGITINKGSYTLEDLYRGHISQQRNELKVLINSTQGGCSTIHK